MNRRVLLAALRPTAPPAIASALRQSPRDRSSGRRSLRRQATVALAIMLTAASVGAGCAQLRTLAAPGSAGTTASERPTGPEYPGAAWVPTPRSNYAPAARQRADVRWIVIHTSEDPAAKAIRRLTDPEAKVSAHYLIARDGRVTQLVRNEDVAYGVGNLAYNKACISIEHERYDGAEVTDVELQASRDLVRWLVARYAITPRIYEGLAPRDPMAGSGVIGHSQVPDLHYSAVGGGENHHTDPVNWNWAEYKTLLGE